MTRIYGYLSVLLGVAELFLDVYLLQKHQLQHLLNILLALTQIVAPPLPVHTCCELVDKWQWLIL